MNDRVLLKMVTGEPYQPARLYYSAPSEEFVTRILAQLQCMKEDSDRGCWTWLYIAEAATITFGVPYCDLPAEAHPIAIGSFSFCDRDQMTLEVRSFERAIGAARFFGPILGSRVVLRRLRVVNRWFEESESSGGLESLDRLLEQNVTVVDQRSLEARLKEALAKEKTRADKRRVFQQFMEERRRRDVPLVEDFPLAPEEDPDDFSYLKTMLLLRSLRNQEHWKGNTHLTFGDIVHRVVEHDVSGEEGN